MVFVKLFFVKKKQPAEKPTSCLRFNPKNYFFVLDVDFLVEQVFAEEQDFVELDLVETEFVFP